jgi:hypothetical protein
MNQRRAYLDTVHTTFQQVGFGPASYQYVTGHTQAWFQWTPGQYAVNATAWPNGLFVTWHHTHGWQYSDHTDCTVRHSLPFTIGADPMDVADGVRRLLQGLTQDLPASTDDWSHADSLAAGQEAW